MEEYAETAAKKVMHESLQDATAAKRIIDFEQESLQGAITRRVMHESQESNLGKESELKGPSEAEQREPKNEDEPKTKQISFADLDANSTLVIPPPQPGDAGLVDQVDQYDQVDQDVPPLLDDAGEPGPHARGTLGLRR